MRQLSPPKSAQHSQDRLDHLFHEYGIEQLFGKRCGDPCEERQEDIAAAIAASKSAIRRTSLNSIGSCAAPTRRAWSSIARKRTVW